MVFGGLILLLISIYGAVCAPYSDPHCKPGRDTIVHLFEWKWSDIKNECAFLASKGYCAVQTSPVTEHAIITNPNRPWWERYQPVSYTIQTRSGNEQEFSDMVSMCNSHGIRIYVDVVINHMTGGFNGTGTAGHYFDGVNCSYPGVPYSTPDFNGKSECPSTDGGIHDWSNPTEVRNCGLLGLKDLKLSKEYVRGKIAGFLNHLISLGVAGFRVDAAKHMWPGDLENIFGRLTNLNGTSFPSGTRPFIYQEVIDFGGEESIKMSEYFNTGRVTNFIYGIKMADIFLRHGDLARGLLNLKINWLMPSSNDVVVFISNHDNQRSHGVEGARLTFFKPKQMKIATAFMLAHPYGFPRIMSSYSWPRDWLYGVDKNNWYGPPHNADMSIKDVQIHSDNTCGGGWICEHRWRQVYNMAKFRSVVQGTTLTHWQVLGAYQIAFSRGNKGFIALVGDNSHMDANLKTGLPSGTYCDVISGNFENGNCTGIAVNVGGDGSAHFNIDGNSDDPVVAIHINAKL